MHKLTDQDVRDVHALVPSMPIQDVRMAMEIAQHASREAILSVITKADSIADSRTSILCVALAYELLCKDATKALMLTKHTVEAMAGAR